LKNLKILIYTFPIFLLSANTASGLTSGDTVHAVITVHNPELSALGLEEDTRGHAQRAVPFPIANPTIESYTSMKQKLPKEGLGSVTNYGIRLSQEFAILIGMLFFSYINKLKREDMRTEEPVVTGCERRQAPVSKARRPLAAAVTGDLSVSTRMTPPAPSTLYRWFQGKQIESGQVINP